MGHMGFLLDKKEEKNTRIIIIKKIENKERGVESRSCRREENKEAFLCPLTSHTFFPIHSTHQRQQPYI